MKITKKQREKIIRKAIRLQPTFLCWALSDSIEDVLGVHCNRNPRAIQKYLPKFRHSTAIKHFNANRGGVWWNTGGHFCESNTPDSENRLRFLRYLLPSKLPKKVKK